ncbi:phosphoglyceromutase [Corynebacterium propinquum]|uniref:phosphoglyceromutase n=1 Tax=Corynebacterium propinquum TaxID=43769 RepID=UPI000668EBDA|nr:phosphoglyceromutase [Corynebacterium propinquum]
MTGPNSEPNSANGKLILLRHGQSTWNESNQFTGWVDVDLTARGENEARRAGELIATAGLKPEIVYTSLLRRAIRSANIALSAANRHWIPVVRNWRINERHYGALQGLNKAETRDKYGEDQFMSWRRSYDTPPPELADDSQYSQAGDPRYADVENPPRTECLKDVVARAIPYFESEILPRLREGQTVLLAAHGNSLRALVKHLDQISDEDIAGLNIPTGMPLVYEFAADGSIVNPGGDYLDPEAAQAGAAAVANQGQAGQDQAAQKQAAQDQAK